MEFRGFSNLTLAVKCLGLYWLEISFVTDGWAYTT